MSSFPLYTIRTMNQLEKDERNKYQLAKQGSIRYTYVDNIFTADSSFYVAFLFKTKAVSTKVYNR